MGFSSYFIYLLALQLRNDLFYRKLNLLALITKALILLLISLTDSELNLKCEIKSINFIFLNTRIKVVR